jgi:regulator of replication initiation timing
MANVSQNDTSAGSAELREMRDELRRLHADNAELVSESARLLRENVRLRTEIRRLRVALEVHITRTRQARLFGPVEMTAGTSVGPRGRRERP